MSALAVVMAFALPFVSCGGDDSPAEAPVLVVNPTSVSMVSTVNATATVEINCNNPWILNGVPEWLNVSSTAGQGKTTIVLTTLSANLSSVSRSATLTVESGEQTASVVVSQLPGLQTGCEVEVKRSTILANSAAFQLSFGSKARTYRWALVQADMANYTDQQFVDYLMSERNPISVETGNELDNIVSIYGLSQESKYTSIFLAFDGDGNRGELVKKVITTPSSLNAPMGLIEDVTYDNNLWYVSITIGPTAHEYYVIGWEGNNAYLMNMQTDAYLAMLIELEEKNLTSFVQSASSLTLTRTSDQLLIFTRAKRSNVWSPVIDRFYGSITSKSSGLAKGKNIINKSSKTIFDKPGELTYSKKETQRYLDNIKIYK